MNAISASEDPVGQVISIDSTARMALVEVQATAICARCASGKGCGAGLLGSGAATRRVAAKLPIDISVDRGDLVQLEMTPGNLLQAALLVYGAPLLGGVMGAASAYQLQMGDLGAAVCALVGLGIGVAAARAVAAKEPCAVAFTPAIHARLKTTTDEAHGLERGNA